MPARCLNWGLSKLRLTQAIVYPLKSMGPARFN